jgi:hypothetical protein
MPENHDARLYLDYDVLYVADLRTILRLFESAYNILQESTQPRGRRRRTNRLTVQTMKTGNSLTVIFTGGTALTMLIGLTKKMFELRESFYKSEKARLESESARDDHQLGGLRKADEARESLHKSEEAKWKALSAKQDYVEKLTKADAAVDGEDMRAARVVAKLIKFIDKSKNVKSIEIDPRDTDPNNSPILKIAEGRKFR